MEICRHLSEVSLTFHPQTKLKYVAMHRICSLYCHIYDIFISVYIYVTFIYITYIIFIYITYTYVYLYLFSIMLCLIFGAWGTTSFCKLGLWKRRRIIPLKYKNEGKISFGLSRNTNKMQIWYTVMFLLLGILKILMNFRIVKRFKSWNLFPFFICENILLIRKTLQCFKVGEIYLGHA